MNTVMRFIVFSGLVLFLFSSCNSIPDHAKLIPGNAIVVAGINTKEIGKKIAWNAILGSKLFEDMKKQQPTDKQDVFDPEKLGVELMSTTYVYVKTDNRFSNGSRITALIPLEDSKQWETFVKNSFPKAVVKDNNGHKEAALVDGMYVGWNNDLLIVMNTLAKQPDVYTYNEDGIDDTTAIAANPVIKEDDAQLMTEMDKAFHITKENAITENEKFTKLEKSGHDITLWINYDALMAQYDGKSMSDMIGMPLSNTLWKDAAFAAGFDFEKGKITGDIRYYMPEEMKETSIELGKDNIDKEMVERLPVNDLDMMIAWHLSPKGVKSLLEKMGVSGFINLALSTQDLSTDFILEAFTGDMVMSLNEFKLEKQDLDSATFSEHPLYNGGVKYTYAIKINKKENFNKLLNLAVSNGALIKRNDNSYTILSESNELTMITNGVYCVISNKPETVNDYMSGKYKGSSLPPAAQNIAKYPLGLYFNAQGVMSTISTDISKTAKDSATIAESKKLLKDVIFEGGSFTDKAFQYKMDINFLNKDESSLLQLMDFAIKMNSTHTEALTVK